jgi:hypothetical protein
VLTTVIVEVVAVDVGVVEIVGVAAALFDYR